MRTTQAVASPKTPPGRHHRALVLVEETVQVVVQATLTGSLQAKLQLRAAGSDRQAETPNLDGSKSSLLLTIPANADDLHLSLALQGDGDIVINELTIQPLRVGATTRVLSAAAGLGIQGLLVGTLGLLGAVVSRRTIGGFIAALVGMLTFFQISQIGPEIAYWLPTVHMNNLQSRWTGDAEGLAVPGDLKVAESARGRRCAVEAGRRTGRGRHRISGRFLSHAPG